MLCGEIAGGKYSEKNQSQKNLIGDLEGNAQNHKQGRDEKEKVGIEQTVAVSVTVKGLGMDLNREVTRLDALGDAFDACQMVCAVASVIDLLEKQRQKGNETYNNKRYGEKQTVFVAFKPWNHISALPFVNLRHFPTYLTIKSIGFQGKRRFCLGIAQITWGV